jgi:serine protease Do
MMVFLRKMNLGFLGLSIFLLFCQSNPHSNSIPEEGIVQQSPLQNEQRISETNKDIEISRETAITRATASAKNAVVGINVTQVKRFRERNPYGSRGDLWEFMFPEFFRDRIYDIPVKSLGSGFLISPEGYLVTNEHVVEDANEILVTLPGGERHTAKVAGSDHVSDIALLKIEGNNLPCIKLGSSSNLIIGEWVIALGNPFGLFEINDQPTVTVGIISAVNRDWGKSEENRLYLDMVQTDAAINRGNSGGPLVNALGEAIGMNTFIYTGNSYQEGFVGIGFAIPSDRIIDVVNQIKEKGGIDRNYWFGFMVQPLNPRIIRALDLKVNEGALIKHVDPESSADEAGLEPGDVIIRVNNQKIKSAENLQSTLENMDLQVGDSIKIEIIRDQKTINIDMKLLRKPE